MRFILLGIKVMKVVEEFFRIWSIWKNFFIEAMKSSFLIIQKKL